MKLTFLGTGAGEGYPGLWCECPHCTYAREHGGKNIRAHSCATIDGKILLDIGPSCFDSAARLGINLTHTTTLLLTHPHEDHLYPHNLYWRHAQEENIALNYREKLHTGSPRFTPLAQLHVYANAETIEKLENSFEITESHHMSLHTVQEGVAFESDGYRITPVRGNHGDHKGFAHSFVVEKDGRTLLYALDTGTYDDDQMKILAKFRFDTVIMEGTTGLNEQYGGHMCLANNVKMKKRFEEMGCMNGDSRFIISHMSPHWCPPHDWYEPFVRAEGMIPAYDGMEIEI